MIANFISDETGQSAVEYALVLLIALVLVTLSASLIENKVIPVISSIGQVLNSGINRIS